MKRKFLTPALFICLVSAAAAQNGTSVLSRYGIGELNPFATGQQRGMGGVATSLYSTFDINQTNPAAWTAVNSLRLEGDLLYEYENYSKYSDLSYGSSALKSLQFAIPLEESYRTRFVFGFLPVSRISYKLSGIDSIDGNRFTTKYDGSGGISLIRVGAAASPFPFLRVGAAFQYYFGTIDQQWTIAFDSSTFYGTNQKRSTVHHGVGFQLGAQAVPMDRLVIGFSLSTPSQLTATRDYFFQYSIKDSTVAGEEGTQDIPLRWSAGASYEPFDGFLIGLDYSMQDWSNAVCFDKTQPELGTASRVSAGAEWQPGKGRLSPGFWSRMTYRLGAYHQKNYASLFGQSETETVVSAGVGIPVFGLNRIDLALEYGLRGSDASLLGARSLLRLAVSFSAGESWFIRRSDE